MDEDVRRFREAAANRFRSAEILFEHERYLDAMYLAGYAVEFSLKALILCKTNSRDRNHWLGQLRRMGHDLDNLKALVRKFDVDIPLDQMDSFRKVTRWLVAWRYEEQLATHEEHDGDVFIKAVRKLVRYLDSRIV